MLDAYGRKIVKTTRQYTGIPVSMGIAPTKVLAKIANRICKKKNLPGAVFNIGSPHVLSDVLASVPVGDVWGIGRRWAEKLNRQNIYTALDLRNADPHRMRDCYNVVMQRLIYELRGEPCLEFEEIEPKKEIIASRSFGERVTDKESLMQAVTLHATRAAEKLRAQESVCGVLQAFIRTGRHNPNEAYYAPAALVRFEVATSDTRRLITAACSAVKQIYRPDVRYAKAGVMLMDISPARGLQTSLFAPGDSAKSVELMRAVDSINRRFGRGSVIFAQQGIKQRWKMKRNRMTPAYTTRWGELPIVH